MKIFIATAAGMCFGVRDALQKLANTEQAGTVAIYGELVHNEVVLHQLETRGFRTIAETERTNVPDEPQIVITAHGISQRRRQQLLDAGKTLIDTTCPLVTRVHDAAQNLARSGAFVIVIGRPDHVEVQGITDDLPAFAVVSNVAMVANYPASKIGIVCQTTVPTEEAAAIRKQIEACNPQAMIQWVDTICQPTKDRQQALNELLKQVQAVVVIGGRHSHNTLRLVDACHRKGLAVLHVQQAEELNSTWFDGFDTVGLTAGTSTLPETIQQVYERLQAISDELQQRVLQP